LPAPGTGVVIPAWEVLVSAELVKFKTAGVMVKEIGWAYDNITVTIMQANKTDLIILGFNG
jgi:hypothetical protein